MRSFKRNLLKSDSCYLNINSKPYAKYRNPRSSGSQDIMLTRLFYCYHGRVEKGHNFGIVGPTEKNRIRFFFVLMLHIKF